MANVKNTPLKILADIRRQIVEVSRDWKIANMDAMKENHQAFLDSSLMIVPIWYLNRIQSFADKDLNDAGMIHLSKKTFKEGHTILGYETRICEKEPFFKIISK